MHGSSGLLNQVLLVGLAEWAVKAGINQINQIFTKYPTFSGSDFTFLTIKTKFLKKVSSQWGPHYHFNHNKNDTYQF